MYGFSQIVSDDLREDVFLDVSKTLDSNIKIDEDSINMAGDANQLVHTEISIKNTGGTSVNVFWKITKIEFNEEWAFSFCDDQLCYRNLEQCPKNKPNPIKAGLTSIWELKVTPSNVHGKGAVLVQLYSDAECTDLLDEVKINISVYPVSTEDFEYKNLTLAPNPASTYFNIFSDEEVSNVEVFNIIGNRVKHFNNNNSGNYNIADLRNGAYLVRVLGKEGKVLKVIKLNVSH